MDKDFAERYLQLLVDEIVADCETATMKAGSTTLASAVTKMKKGTSPEVPFASVTGAPENQRNLTWMSSG